MYFHLQKLPCSKTSCMSTRKKDVYYTLAFRNFWTLPDLPPPKCQPKTQHFARQNAGKFVPQATWQEALCLHHLSPLSTTSFRDLFLLILTSKLLSKPEQKSSDGRLSVPPCIDDVHHLLAGLVKNGGQKWAEKWSELTVWHQTF